MDSSPNIGIIGSGIGGLAAGVRLAAKGYRVHIFEKEAQAGGKLSQFSREGFRFDKGPSLFTLPALLEELLALDTDRNAHGFSYSALDIICRYFYPDGAVIDAYRDPEKFAAEIELKTGVPSKRVRKYLRQSEKVYDLTKDVFIFNDPRNLKRLMNFGTLKSLLQAWKLQPFSSLHEANRRAFGHDHVVQLFDRFATYNGSNPYKAPATLKVIPHLEHNIGAFFPEGGMYSIVETLTGIAERSGVQFHFSEKVTSVSIESNTAKGIKTAQGDYAFDAIVSDADVHTFGGLAGRQIIRTGKADGRLSSSAIIFYWGMKTSQADLILHNILFSGDYKHEFDCIFNRKTISDDPTVYIFISAKEVPRDAPPGHENWFVMINTPENTGQDWKMLVDAARKNIQQKIKSMLHIDVKQHLLFEHVASPETIERETGAYRGALYGLNSNSAISAFRRHPNQLRSVKNLYFTGGSVHPGGGIPLCLASAKIVSSMFADLNRKP